MLDSLIEIFTDYGYFAVFGMLLACGFGFPLPEDITLVAGGVISGLACAESDDFWLGVSRCPNVHVMLAVSMAGVLIGDVTMMTLGRVMGLNIRKIKWIGRILTDDRVAAVKQKVSRYGSWIVFAARFMPGLRSPIFIVVGITKKVSYLRFILTDGAAALISVPLWVYIGFYGAQQRSVLLKLVKRGEITSYVLIGLVAVFFIISFYMHRRSRAR